MTRFLAGIGDRINPIVVKETRQAVNSRLVAGFLLLFLAIQFVVMLLMIGSRELSDPDEINLRAGRQIFTFVQGILLGTCMVLIPTMTGVRLASERSDVNVDLLFISSLTPRAVISGKLFAAAALALLIFSACAPFMTFAYVMRGLDVPTILVVLAADYLAVLAATMFALFLASIPANRGLRILLGLGGFVNTCYWGIMLLAGSSAFLSYGSGFDTAGWEFWAGCAAAVALTFGGIGLMFVWSVALISPPAANRAFGVRVYTAGLWLATAAGFAGWSAYSGEPELVLAWGAIWAGLFALQFLIAICERDKLGARVARRVPRNPLLRAPAFLFYSGAAGGLTFGVVGAALTAVAVAAWYEIVPSSRSFADGRQLLIVPLLAGYAYCYCVSAVIFRRLLGPAGFPAGVTWLIALILFGFGCTMPFIIRFALFDDGYRYGSMNDMIALYLPNPVVMLDDATDRTDSHVVLTVFFLVLWGGVATAVNAPWLVKQVANFHPQRAERPLPRATARRPAPEAEAVEVAE